MFWVIKMMRMLSSDQIFFCPSSYLIFYSHVIEKEWKNNGWKLCTAGHFLLVYREISVG